MQELRTSTQLTQPPVILYLATPRTIQNVICSRPGSLQQMQYNLRKIEQNYTNNVQLPALLLLCQTVPTGALRNTRACVRRQENGEQDRRQTRNASLRSKRQQESAEQMEQWRQARPESDRQLAQTDSHRQTVTEQSGLNPEILKRGGGGVAKIFAPIITPKLYPPWGKIME